VWAQEAVVRCLALCDVVHKRAKEISLSLLMPPSQVCEGAREHNLLRYTQIQTRLGEPRGPGVLMRAAIAAGLEIAPIGVVTTPCTKNPKYVPTEPLPLPSLQRAMEHV
jgi:hypothetical protein